MLSGAAGILALQEAKSLCANADQVAINYGGKACLADFWSEEYRRVQSGLGDIKN